ncbi:porin [Paenirhodobacter sp. CAU 1674]|uniref:porin n=1 Tax=Paenirhodobacter sp. CAU 1674 TaxID=3032596 RepID=UPI0023D9A540|nr:porin [Paenirhodobacter sp. CAU 1674]MDF2140432.1 porin [Paenirhodobacter sp. CAU 1674]
MKKVLLATTALVLSAGFAAAEVKIDGSANFGLKYNEAGLGYADDKEAAGWYEIDMNVTGTMETDTGLTFGAQIQLDSNYGGGDWMTKDGKRSLDQNYDANVFVSGAFGTIKVGESNWVASDDYGLTDIGFDGIGVDDTAEISMYGHDEDSVNDLRWDYTVGAVSMTASIDTISEDYGLALGYDAGTFGGAIAFDHDEESGYDSTSVLLTASFGAFSGEVYYADGDQWNESYGIYGAYKTGPWTFEAAVADADEAADTSYGIGAKYDLGGGAVLAGGIGSVEGDTAADFGVTFRF